METGIDPSLQILTFALQILEVGHTLSFYNINRIPVTIILTIKPDSAPDPAPDPVQQSRIFSVMPNQAYADSATAIEAQGKFIEQIRNIQVDGVNLPQGSWTQTPTSILFTVGKSKAKSISITLFNGSAPVMQIDPIPVIPSEYISTVKMKPKVTYIFCSRPGHGVRVYHGFNPACPSGSSKV